MPIEVRWSTRSTHRSANSSARSMFACRSPSSSGLKSGSEKNRSISASSMQSTDAPDAPVPRGSHDTTSNRSVISGGNQPAAFERHRARRRTGASVVGGEHADAAVGVGRVPRHLEIERRPLRIVIVDRHGDRADFGAIGDRLPGDAVRQRRRGRQRRGRAGGDATRLTMVVVVVTPLTSRVSGGGGDAESS